jgi:glutamyl/glutaminyl-tRNA synthetase
VGRSDTIYDPEKFRWLSAQHVARLSPDAFVEAVSPFVDRERFPLRGDALRIALLTIRTRIHTYAEVNEHLKCFYPVPGEHLEQARAEVRDDPSAREVLQAQAARMEAVPSWTTDALTEAVRQAGRDTKAKGPALYHPLRKALTGDESGPDLSGIMAALGRDEVLARIRATLVG